MPKAKEPLPPETLNYATRKCNCATCNDGIFKGDLRMGVKQVTPANGMMREGMQWRHFGCLATTILSNRMPDENTARRIDGFRQLKEDDQELVLTTARDGRVPAEYVTLSRRPKAALPRNLPAASPKKIQPSARNPPQTPQQSTSATLISDGFEFVTPEIGNTVSSDDEQDYSVFYVRYCAEVIKADRYDGKVRPGDEVNLVRDPLSQFGQTQTLVTNSENKTVGCLTRGVASDLAPLLDRRLVVIEAEMITGNHDKEGRRLLKVQLDIYGPQASRSQLARHLQWAGTLSETGIPPQKRTAAVAIDVPGSSVPNKKARKSLSADDESESARYARRLMEALQRREQNEVNDGLLDVITDGVNPWKLPLHPNPPSIENGFLKNNLLPHQSQGLAWMIERENPQLPPLGSAQTVQLWQHRQGLIPHWYNIATKTEHHINQRPTLGRGGFMADSMGLGKTLVILSLILATLEEPAPEHCNTTLIVCPKSVLGNWETQIRQHIGASANFNYKIFHGKSRQTSRQELESCDAVITTYETLVGCIVNEHETATSDAPTVANTGNVIDLSKIKWKRAVLDEAHDIKSAKTKKAKACHSLIAHRRWVVTGTPILNGPKDLSSLLQFLKICKPLDTPNEFKKLFLDSFDKGSSHGCEILRSIMTNSCLRRTAEMVDEDGNRMVKLPPVDFFEVKIDLHDADREAYDMAMSRSQRAVELYQTNNHTGDLPPAMLTLLLRLRQLALSRALLPVGYIDDMRPEITVQVGDEQLSEVDLDNLTSKLKLAVEDSEECPICYNSLTLPRITRCGHVFCLSCIEKVIREQQMCPMDRTLIASEQLLLELPPERLLATNHYDLDDMEAPLPTSAKIEHLVMMLSTFTKGQKSLVFSQFTKYLAQIEPHLVSAGIPVVKFDGSLTVPQREALIKEFQTPIPPEQIAAGWQRLDPKLKGKGRKRIPAVMLISLKAGSTGINLTAAQNVFLMDPWWQSAIEAQAIGRAHRLGQMADKVQVFQMIAKNTVEEKVLQIQEQKNQQIRLAFSGHQIKEDVSQKKTTRMQEIKEMLGIQAPTANRVYYLD